MADHIPGREGILVLRQSRVKNRSLLAALVRDDSMLSFRTAKPEESRS